jgi:hypothetical protein
VSERLAAFLTARELDDAAELAVEWSALSPAEQARVRDVLDRIDDPPALRNLLLHPEAIPADLLVSALVTGLHSEDGAIALAAVVGAHRVAGRLSEADRRAVARPVLEHLSVDRNAIIRQRASAAVVVLASERDSQTLMGFLVDLDPVVCHNVRAALVRTLGARGAAAAVSGAARDQVISPQAARFVNDAVDGGSATNHELITRGVLGPQLVPITILES